MAENAATDNNLLILRWVIQSFPYISYRIVTPEVVRSKPFLVPRVSTPLAVLMPAEVGIVKANLDLTRFVPVRSAL